MLRQRKINHWSFTVFWLAVSLAYVLGFVLADFAGTPWSSSGGLAVIAAQVFVVAVFSAAVIGLMAVWRPVFAVTFPLLVTLSAVAAWFRLTMNISLTPNIVQVVVVNDLNTWGTVITADLIVWTLAALAFGVLAAVCRYRQVQQPGRPWVWTAAFAVVAAVPVSVARLEGPVLSRMPYSMYSATRGYLRNRTEIAENRNNFENTPAVSGADSLDVVVVIGESLRADRLGLNGYGRQTTPGLSADTAVVSLPRMFSPLTFTYVSVPRIVTRADADHPDRAYSEQSFITLFRRAGFSTAWLSNQDDATGYVYFMHEADTLRQVNAGRSLYDYADWYDTDLLPPLDSVLAAGKPRSLTVLHTIGQHWWTPSHTPDSLVRWKPVADSRVIAELSPAMLSNSYDNSVLATDDFLCRVIHRLRNRRAVVIFISDHGEALGEDGIFLHAGDPAPGTAAYNAVHNTACLVWYSVKYAQSYPRKIRALRAGSARNFTTDNIFHSVLDAADIATPALDLKLSFMR